jgi:hypothetical protein
VLWAKQPGGFLRMLGAFLLWIIRLEEDVNLLPALP